MSYQSEAELEKQLVKQLESQGYSKVKIRTEEELIKNFRDKLNKYNEKKLEGVPLTDKEFERVMRKVEGESIFESAKILRDKWSLKGDDGLEVYIEFFNSKSWCKNIFEVTT
ncbi:hypothetical protein GCM10008906_16340 [Clostridium oceanicum]|uniref:Restriction endonuclease type I HsdR N-terminal domain-containing protein n=1 Tax=Clostridium oceanicum TaxID=1543 RepID=A0ABN1JFQ2_9CLOT